jgi:long-chain acyl-CoA synthetase
VLEVDPPERAAGLPGGWLPTADRARLDADGFLWILGRLDDVIIRGGFKVDLAQVDAALLRHPAVAEAVAVGVPDPRIGTVPTGLGVLHRGAAVSPDAVTASTRETLPAYAVPVAVRQVDAIPRTATMKASRTLAAALFADR